MTRLPEDAVLRDKMSALSIAYYGANDIPDASKAYPSFGISHGHCQSRPPCMSSSGMRLFDTAHSRAVFRPTPDCPKRFIRGLLSEQSMPQSIGDGTQPFLGKWHHHPTVAVEILASFRLLYDANTKAGGPFASPPQAGNYGRSFI
jgi:hypothetical protein